MIAGEPGSREPSAGPSAANFSYADMYQVVDVTAPDNAKGLCLMIRRYQSFVSTHHHRYILVSMAPSIVFHFFTLTARGRLRAKKQGMM